MSFRWSEEEHDIIRFINSYNNQVVKDGHREMRYTADDVYDIWNNYFPQNYRGFESVKHKMREVESFSLDESMIKFLNSNQEASIMDLMEYYHIFDFMAEKCIEYYENKFMYKFYDRDTEEVYTEDLKNTIIENPKVSHNITIDTNTKVDPITTKDLDTMFGIDKPSTEEKPDTKAKLEIPEAPIKKKGKNANKKLTKKSKYKTLAEVEEEQKVEEPKHEDEYVPFSALHKMIDECTVHLKVGIIGDTHIGNMFYDENTLNNYYKICNDLGVKYIMHAGDLVDGHNMYTAQSKEQNLHGFEEQVRYVIANYPHYDDIVTYVISGNHDMCYYNNTMLHPIVSISRSRKDIIYANDYYANIDIDGIKITMIHTDGNSGSEPMTKLKKLISNRSEDCDILVMGHLHQSMELHDYNGVPYACAPGSFLKTSAYTIRRGFNCALGGYILDILKNTATNQVKITSTWIGDNYNE